jgi:hypothetical protein
MFPAFSLAFVLLACRPFCWFEGKSGVAASIDNLIAKKRQDDFPECQSIMFPRHQCAETLCFPTSLYRVLVCAAFRPVVVLPLFLSLPHSFVSTCLHHIHRISLSLSQSYHL